MNRAVSNCGVAGRRWDSLVRRWLGVLLVLVVLGDLALVHEHESAGQFGITLVCWMAVWSSLRRRVSRPGGTDPGIVGLALGGLLLGALLIAVLRTTWTARVDPTATNWIVTSRPSFSKMNSPSRVKRWMRRARYERAA